MNEEQRDQAKATAERAVADLVQQIDPGTMMTKFVLLVECVDTEGRGLWAFAGPSDLKKWESLGMIEYARTLELLGEG